MIDFREIYKAQNDIKELKIAMPKKFDKAGGIITGDVQFNKYLKINAFNSYGSGTIDIWADKNNEGALRINGAKDIRVNDNLIYHAGRKPTPNDLGVLPADTWNISGQNLLVHSKRALVGTSNGTLHLSYGNDFTDVRVNNNKIFHENNKPLWSDIAEKPLNFVPSSHNHDNMYYTESEVNTKLLDKLDKTGGTVSGDLTVNKYFKMNPYGPSYGEGQMSMFLNKNGTGHLDINGVADLNVDGAWVYHTKRKPTWADIQEKPSTFAPIIGTASNQAAAGNHGHIGKYLTVVNPRMKGDLVHEDSYGTPHTIIHTKVATVEADARNGLGIALGAGGTSIFGSGESAKALLSTISNTSSEETFITSDNSIQLATSMQQGVDNRKIVSINGGGSIVLEHGGKVTFNNRSDTWKSVELWRGTDMVEYGVGQWSATQKSARINGTGGTALDIIPGGMMLSKSPDVNISKQCYLGFYNGLNGTRYGYLGKGDTSNDHMYLRSDNSLFVGTKFSKLTVFDSNGFFRPNENNGWSLGHSSQRFATVYYTNLNAASDTNLKKNIEYIDDNKYLKKAKSVSKKDFHDFVKGDLKLARYDYISERDAEDSSNKIGFIAQDIRNTKVGNAFIMNKEDHLSYDLTDYVNIIAGALQVEINEKDEKIKILENRLSALEQVIL